MTETDEVRAARERRQRIKSGENAYRVYMPEAYASNRTWTETDESQFLRLTRRDNLTLADAYCAIPPEVLVGVRGDDKLSPDHLLHHLWTKAVGTSDYVKEEWRQLEAEFWNLKRELRDLKEEKQKTALGIEVKG